MKRVWIWFAAMIFALGFSGLASAQRHGGGKPATTAVEHAETKANPHGDRGVENAENKQAQHKRKHKKHHHSH